MSLYYSSVVTRPIIGTKSGVTLTPAVLTNAYATGPTKIIQVGGQTKVDLAIQYTMGAAETANSIEVKVEHSPDGTNFYRIPNEEVTTGTSTLTAREFTFVGTNADVATISIGLDIFYEWIKVSVKESGVASNVGTVYVEATICGK